MTWLSETFSGATRGILRVVETLKLEKILTLRTRDSSGPQVDPKLTPDWQRTRKSASVGEYADKNGKGGGSRRI